VTHPGPVDPSRRTVMRRGVSAVLAAVVLAGCGPTTSTGLPGQRDPSEADLRRLEQQIEALPGVDSAELKYFAADPSNSQRWAGTIASDDGTEAELVDTLWASWKVIWDAGEFKMGPLAFDVYSSAGRVGYAATGLNTNPATRELQARFGPRPSPPPSTS
jgi:hypothetical protein